NPANSRWMFGLNFQRTPSCAWSWGIPVALDARGRVETVRAGSATTDATGHYVTEVAEQETVRSCADGKPQEARRNDALARPPGREVTAKASATSSPAPQVRACPSRCTACWGSAAPRPAA